MKKEIEVDLTSLLDVLLIIFFAILLTSNASTLTAQQDLAQITQENTILISENKNLKAASKDLNANKVLLEKELSELKLQITEDQLDFEMKYQNLQSVVDALSDWLGSSQEDMTLMMVEMADPDFTQQHLKEIIETKDLLEKLFEYDTLTTKFTFVDITVKTEGTGQNKVYINEQDTDLYIVPEDWYDLSLRNYKVAAISQAIDQYLDGIEGGTPLILMTYKHDDNIYRYVSNVIQASMTTIQTLYGIDTTLKTELVLIDP